MQRHPAARRVKRRRQDEEHEKGLKAGKRWKKSDLDLESNSKSQTVFQTGPERREAFGKGTARCSEGQRERQRQSTSASARRGEGKGERQRQGAGRAHEAGGEAIAGLRALKGL